MLEEAIFTALRGLVADRVYPDYAPAKADRPYITYQQVGGFPVNFLDGGAPTVKNARYRLNVWANTRAEASAMSAQIETTLRNAADLRTTVLTNPVALEDAETRLRGASQDFSFWF